MSVRHSSSFPLSSVLVGLLPVSWLLANHHVPWLAAWQEGLALLLLLLAGLMVRRDGWVPRAWGVASLLIVASLVAQQASGQMAFSGDALMVLLYVAAFVGALALGAGLVSAGVRESRLAVDLLAMGLFAGAAISVHIALSQWGGGSTLPIFIVDLPPGGRPYGNFAQANHLCTAAFLGLCGVALLRESNRIGRIGFWVSALYLVAGITITGSRTGWLQVSLLAGAMAWLGKRTGAQLRGRDGLALLGAYALAIWAWPTLNEVLLHSGARDHNAQLQAGVRLPYWIAMLDAIGRAPWTGYGWQQVSAAQWAVALDHPPIGYVFEHAHNVLLDLLLCAGVPAGGAIAMAGTWALAAPLHRLRDPRALWLTVAALGLVVHGLLEFPLEYAYFLLPMGLVLGAAHGLSPGQGAWRVPAAALRASFAALAVLFVAVALDYVEAEQNHRQLNLEAAHIGTHRIESSAPNLRVLDQLEALLAFARTEARAGMSPTELQQMARVTHRWPIPPAMLRYALAAGLNGQTEEARQTLARLCRIHSRQRCREVAPAWGALQHRFPLQLRDIAPPPEAAGQ